MEVITQQVRSSPRTISQCNRCVFVGWRHLKHTPAPCFKIKRKKQSNKIRVTTRVTHTHPPHTPKVQTGWSAFEPWSPLRPTAPSGVLEPSMGWTSSRHLGGGRRALKRAAAPGVAKPKPLKDQVKKRTAWCGSVLFCFCCEKVSQGFDVQRCSHVVHVAQD